MARLLTLCVSTLKPQRTSQAFRDGSLSPRTARSFARNALKRSSLFKLPVPLPLTQLLQLMALLSLRGLDLIELPLLCFVRRIRKCGPRFERKLALYTVAWAPRNAGDMRCEGSVVPG